VLTPASNIAIIGFGDACRRFAAALAPRGCALRVFAPQADRSHIEALGVDVTGDLATALRGARLVVLDTALAAVNVATQLRNGQLLLDMTPADNDAMADTDAQVQARGAGRCVGRFEIDAAAADDAGLLCIAGNQAASLAAALAAMGLPSAPAPAGWQPDDSRPLPPFVNRATPAAVRRGELP
jgi:3-hydroxyisobutyrate dehydrogenase-like beta-hydroxyacid dehydrogenase